MTVKERYPYLGAFESYSGGFGGTIVSGITPSYIGIAKCLEHLQTLATVCTSRQKLIEEIQKVKKKCSFYY